MVLTLGAEGAVYADASVSETIAAVPVEAVDTTAAGDTFVGYFLAALVRGAGVARALEDATRAAALCVTRTGAAPSIPHADELGTPAG